MKKSNHRLFKDEKWITEANEDSNSVSLIDVSTLKTVMEIPIEAESPKHAVMSPDSQWIYISAKD
jgi:hypothetical protein